MSAPEPRIGQTHRRNSAASVNAISVLALADDSARVIEDSCGANQVRDAVVECGVCRLCCHHQKVMVTDGDDPGRYDTEQIGPFLFLKQRPDGACVHLGPGGCGVYADRPRICRAFDCGGWFRSIPRNERRRMSKEDATVAALIKRGREVSARQVLP
ncbi:MAG TPA: YkgJ family cysteine cluster protein [Caulobacteraceae bacterium]|jgi:hypothetical protein